MEKNDENFDRSDVASAGTEHAKLMLANQNESSNGSRVLAFKSKAPEVMEGYQNSMKVLYSAQSSKKSEVVKPTRHIPSAPIRVLDAPDMMDDYCKQTFRPHYYLPVYLRHSIDLFRYAQI